MADDRAESPSTFAQEAADDERAREQASDPRRSVLLQAPAGSGKTTVLTERLLRLLAEVDEPEEILAVTFTRKAAAEMRARVLNALRGEIDVGNAHGARLRTLADAALATAARRGWNLAQDPGRLRIQTLDAFNFRLAAQLTVTAKAGGALVIAERPQELYELAARHTLTAADDDPVLAADVELLFERLDNRWNNVQGLLAEMLPRRGHWLRYVLGHESGALCARISESLEDVVQVHLTRIQTCFPPALRAELCRLPGVGSLGTDLQCLPAWKRLACLTLTNKCEWRKAQGIGRRLGAAYEEAGARDALRAAIGRMGAVPGLREALVEVNALPAPTLSAADAEAIEALSRVLRLAAAQLQAQFAVAGRVDHTYVAGAARAALTDAGLPTDLALRTGLTLRHILVDEFQDTSLAQFDLIEMLTAGWEAGDGRTLFVVGDPMQSIYQFREAEVGLFLRARDQGIGGIRLDRLRLTRNFRAAPQLIAWTNDAFAALFPRSDDLRASAVSFTPSVSGEKERTDDANRARPVQVRLFAGGARESETAAITERIIKLADRDPQATIAVLVASRSHAVAIMTGLEERGVDVVGVDLVPLRELPIVRDLVALTGALSHLGDRTAWLAVLRAPWCGVSLPSLTVLSRRDDPLLVWEAMTSEERLAECSHEDRARLNRVRSVIESALAARNCSPLADWLEMTWLRLGAADAYAEPELDHARAFFAALSDRFASGEWSGAQDLESLLGDLFARPRASSHNPVQIMTIHRAKGLEFDHVFVPCLDRDLNRGPEPLLRWLDLPRPDGGSDLIMAPVPAIGDEARSDVGRYLRRLTYRRAANERMRLLYVAATRARKSLELSAAPRTRTDGTLGPRPGTLLACLWPVVEPMCAAGQGQVIAAGAGDAMDATTSVPGVSVPSSARADCEAGEAGNRVGVPGVGALRVRRLVSGWVRPPLEQAPDWSQLPLARQSLEPPPFSWVGETARHIGTVVHAALEKFGTLAGLPATASIEDERDSHLGQLRRHGVPEGELARATAVVTEALTRTVSNDRGRWIFDASHRDARSELALTGLCAGRLTNVVIDRSFVDRDGTRWVIDFKTSRHEGGGIEGFLEQEMQRYRVQLETYVALARGLGPQPVRAALYFPLLDAFRELS